MSIEDGQYMLQFDDQLELPLSVVTEFYDPSTDMIRKSYDQDEKS